MFYYINSFLSWISFFTVKLWSTIRDRLVSLVCWISHSISVYYYYKFSYFSFIISNGNNDSLFFINSISCFCSSAQIFKCLGISFSFFLLLSRLYYDLLFADLLRALPEIFETFNIFSFSLLWVIVFYFAPTLEMIDVLERFDGRVYIFKYL